MTMEKDYCACWEHTVGNPPNRLKVTKGICEEHVAGRSSLSAELESKEKRIERMADLCQQYIDDLVEQDKELDALKRENERLREGLLEIDKLNHRGTNEFECPECGDMIAERLAGIANESLLNAREQEPKL